MFGAHRSFKNVFRATSRDVMSEGLFVDNYGSREPRGPTALTLPTNATTVFKVTAAIM
jgi:hypothetical protein